MKNIEKERVRKVEEKIWKLHALESVSHMIHCRMPFILLCDNRNYIVQS